MKHLSILLGTMCLAGFISGAHAQAARVQASPFGVATPAQKQLAVQADTARLNALAAWANLPANLQQSLTEQMATMSEADRLALLQTVPSLKGLAQEEYQQLLAQIAETTPYPNLFMVKPQDVHFLFGYSVQLQAFMGDELLTSGVTWSTVPIFVIDPGTGVLHGRTPFYTSNPVTATQVATGATARTTVTMHVVTVDIEPGTLSVSGPSSLSGTASIDARVPLGPLSGTISFWLQPQFGSPALLCETAPVVVQPDAAGFRTATGSCNAPAGSVPSTYLASGTATVIAQFRGTGDYSPLANRFFDPTVFNVGP